jgi:hypothetical protein
VSSLRNEGRVRQARFLSIQLSGSFLPSSPPLRQIEDNSVLCLLVSRLGEYLSAHPTGMYLMGFFYPKKHSDTTALGAE